MSLSINFDPHSWYMGFAIQKDETEQHTVNKWWAYTDDGMTYRVVEFTSNTLTDLHEQIRQHHLKQKNWYGEQIAKRRLNHIRYEIMAERVSQAEIVELQGLTQHIEDGDTLLLEWAGVPEDNTKKETK